MNIAMIQMNATVGDYEQNKRKILDFANEAAKQGADLVVFPEAALCGYPAQDLMKYTAFIQACRDAEIWLHEKLPDNVCVLFGSLRMGTDQGTGTVYNGAVAIYKGKEYYWQAKTLLPTYDVFDESRYFTPAQEWNVLEYGGLRIGVSICEDIWCYNSTKKTAYTIDPVEKMLSQDCDMLLVLSASPYEMDKQTQRINLLTNINKRYVLPILSVNMVGGNDNLIFDGYSSYMAKDGTITHLAAGFKEDIVICDTAKTHKPIHPDPKQAGKISKTSNAGKSSREAELSDLQSALILGIRDYVSKTGFKRAHLGLSGGIDSALVATLASKALGSENLSCVLMPSQFTSEASNTDAYELADRLKVHTHTVPITPIYDAYAKAFGSSSNFEGSVASENIQARIRGDILMTHANLQASFLLATGNKSELSVGYCTLYGDMAGGLAPIGDVFKTDVFALCHFINSDKEIIPNAILEKEPSAELRLNQKDQDSLPPYELLDEILKLHIIDEYALVDIINRGYDKIIVQQVLNLVGSAEFKRFQAPPVLRVMLRAFGYGRRIPIARKLL